MQNNLPIYKNEELKWNRQTDSILIHMQNWRAAILVSVFGIRQTEVHIKIFNFL
jgi:hypothetical protein